MHFVIRSLLALLACCTAQVAVARDQVVVERSSASRLLHPRVRRAEAASVAKFGPFRVLANGHAALVDATDGASPEQFAALLAAYPDVDTIELINVPGTYDDVANLEVGRMIRQRGVATLVPHDGSVRSGGVELFLAGSTHSAHPDSRFAVHAWMDYDGREASDYAPDAPENRRYLSYYEEMGMSSAQARAFYAFTNSAPYDHALWLSGAEMNDRTTGSGELLHHTAKADLPEIAYHDML